MYDLLIVGSGLSAATLVATLRHCLKIAVLETRPHLGGNCFDRAAADESSRGTRIHQYGPHIFHSPCPRITNFLSQFTDWTPYTHKVLAMVESPPPPLPRGGNPRPNNLSPTPTRSCNPKLLPPQSLMSALYPLPFDPLPSRLLPFPYSQATIAALGHTLTEQQLLNTFFRHYSQKMWAMPWESLPNSIRARIPRDLTHPPESPLYYRNQFVALPKRGYTPMLENMLDGAHITLNADPLQWTHIKARNTIYTGRPDLIPLPPLPSSPCLRASVVNDPLPFRTLDIAFSQEHWGPETADAICLHNCTPNQPWTRKTNYTRMTHVPMSVVPTPSSAGRMTVTPMSSSAIRTACPPTSTPSLISTETPRAATSDDLTPYYPIELESNRQHYLTLAAAIRRAYPTLHLAGRLGSYRYFDMYQAVAQALTLAQKLFPTEAPATRAPTLSAA